MPTSIKRKLVAIMFTDIAGYTSQMSKDQDMALNLLDTKRKAIKLLVNKYNGTLVKEMGDGTLSHFPSAIDATECSLELQEKFKKNRDLNIRIGLHLGDTSFRDKDIFGDGVNVASRLETMSPPGGILISKNIYDEISSRKGFDTISLGLQSIKGVGRLIEVFGLKNDYLEIPNPDDYKNTKIKIHSDDEIPSIAIIPFNNKGKKKDSFYAYGISSDLISDVSSAGKIRVSSKKQVEELSNLHINDLANKLLVRYVVTGELWREDDLFQLSIELFDTKASKVVWADRWEESWDHLPEIKVKLTDGLLKSLDTKHAVNKQVETNSSKAYELYLQAKYKFSKRKTKEDIENARTLIKKSLLLDANLILAKNLLGFTYFEEGENDTAMVIFQESLKQSEEKNDKYCKADVLRTISLIWSKKGDSKKAIKNLNTSLEYSTEINNKSGIAQTYNMFGFIYFNTAEYKKAFKMFKESYEIFIELDDDRGKAQELDNLAVIETINCNYNHALRHYQNSIQIKRKLEDDRGMAFGLTNLGALYYMIGKFKEALKNYHKALELSKPLNINYSIANLMENIGIIFRDQGKFSTALDYHIKSLSIKEKEEDKVGVIRTLNNIGIDYYRMENFNLSIDNFERALDIINEIKLNDSSLILEIKTFLFLSYKSVNKIYDLKEIENLIDEVENVEFNLNYHLYILLEKKEYLKKSYSLVEKIINGLNHKEKEEFLNCSIPRLIISSV